MLCADEVVNLDIDCPVDIEAGEFACVRISNIRLDITKIQGECANNSFEALDFEHFTDKILFALKNWWSQYCESL